MVVGLFVGVWIARYLGPEQFGLFSYAQSFVGLFTAIATLGLDGIVVRELVKDESKRDVLIGTAFWLKIMGAILTLVVLAIAINFTSNDTYTNTLVFIIASATIFQSFNVIDFYFQSKVLSKYVVYANIISLLFSSIVKVTLLLNNAPLEAFAWVVLFDSIVLACGFIYFYIKTNLPLLKWKFNKKEAVDLLKDSWPLILSATVVTIYMRIDIIMLNEFLGKHEVGLYSASNRISEVWYFIPVVITASLYPGIINMKNVSNIAYENRLKNLYKILVWVAIAIAILITFISKKFIVLLFGIEYINSSNILIIHIWSGVFTSFLMVSNKWLLVENKTKFIFIRGLLGAVINVILNYIYIPIYGVTAAAITSLISLVFTSLIIDLFTNDTRQHLYIKLSVFIPKLYTIAPKRDSFDKTNKRI
jgi:O-antigen/teichoic acid export membrane protein